MLTREAILALLAAISGDLAADLTDEQIAQAETDLLSAFDAVRAGDVEDVDPTDVDLLSQVADGIDGLRALAAERIDAAAERQAAIDALAERVAAPAETDPEAETEAETEPAAETEPTAAETETEPESAAEVETEPETEREAVAASAPRPRVRPSLSAIRDRAPAPAAPPAETADAVILDARGGRFANMREVAAAAAERHADFAGTSARATEFVRVARIPGNYAADRVLDGTADLDRIAAVTDREAIVASGGFCAPAEVNYDLITVGVTARPVRDALARFQATRGSVQLPAPPTLADVDVAGADAAVGQHTNTEDEASASKPIQVIDCADFTTYETYAVTKRLQFGNFGARAFPEQVTAWNDLTLVAHARFAEGLLLDSLKTLSTNVTTAKVFGAARDLAEAVIRGAVGWRSRHRAPDARLRVLMPWWAPLMGAVDIMRGSDDADTIRQAQDLFTAMVGNAGVNVSFYLDTPSSGVSQVIGAQAAAALDGWPTTVQWAMFDEGHFLFLDGGNLDLGMVRDSTLNETNDFQTFAETFEGVGKHGVEALWVTSTVCPNGEFQIPVDANITCGS